ncbi:MAG: hypothetical protein JJT96_04325 [Opitutales bacterium]|nr:hypothetical protein [Opitutales bacterium]
MQPLDYPHLESKGFIGAIECTDTGVTIQSSGEEVELLGQVLGYVTQIGNMIGESFGLDNLEEAHLIGSNTTAVCIPLEGNHLGVLCSNRAQIDSLISEILN